MNDKQKATLTGTSTNNGRNHGDGKETINSYSAVVIHKGRIAQPVTVRCYMGRSAQATKVYAAIWAHGNGHSYSGTGSASGCGYCKRSAAAGIAISNAGIKLAKDIDGQGTQAIEDAMAAIARAMGYRGKVEIIRN